MGVPATKKIHSTRCSELYVVQVIDLEKCIATCVVTGFANFSLFRIAMWQNTYSVTSAHYMGALLYVLCQHPLPVCAKSRSPMTRAAG